MRLLDPIVNLEKITTIIVCLLRYRFKMINKIRIVTFYLHHYLMNTSIRNLFLEITSYSQIKSNLNYQLINHNYYKI